MIYDLKHPPLFGPLQPFGPIRSMSVLLNLLQFYSVLFCPLQSYSVYFSNIRSTLVIFSPLFPFWSIQSTLVLFSLLGSIQSKMVFFGPFCPLQSYSVHYGLFNLVHNYSIVSIWSLAFQCYVNLVHIVKVVKIGILYKIVEDWWDRGLLDGIFFFFLKNKSKKHIDSGFMLNNLILYTFIHLKKKKTKIYINIMPYLYHELPRDFRGYCYISILYTNETNIFEF